MALDFKAPIHFDRVLDDADLVRRLVEHNGPYAPVQRYFSNETEYRTSSGRPGGDQPMIVAPNFRGDWAYEEPLIEDVMPLFGHEGFRKAAAELFGVDRVEPFSLYANITWQLPFDQGTGHTDVPEFRGIDRTRHPITFLLTMGHSRLFESERVQIATAVAWFYEGADGGFAYWPDGPDAPPSIHEGSIFNTALEADNERMYHRVRPVGRREDGMLMGMTLDSRLVHRSGNEWAIVSDESKAAQTMATFGYQDLRISVSWKARVFHDEEEERLYRDHSADLTLEEVTDRFCADLDARGIAHQRPRDASRNADFLQVLSRAYVRSPTIFDERPASSVVSSRHDG
jgi:hypothetical protein